MERNSRQFIYDQFMPTDIQDFLRLFRPVCASLQDLDTILPVGCLGAIQDFLQDDGHCLPTRRDVLFIGFIIVCNDDMKRIVVLADYGTP